MSPALFKYVVTIGRMVSIARDTRKELQMPVSILLVFLIDNHRLVGEDHMALVMQQLTTPDEEPRQIRNMLNGSHADNEMKPAVEIIGEREHIALMQMDIRKLAFAAPNISAEVSTP